MHRPLTSLRVSLTDRCNMRCRYCMPEDEYTWLPRESILTFEEIVRLVRVFAGLGVRRVRLTGGEPLLRQGLPELVRLLRREVELSDLALTTNGLLLSRWAEALFRAGLDRVTVSLDTLRADRMEAFARTDRHSAALAGIDAACSVGFRSVKVNAVVVRGFNDDEVLDLIEFGRARRVEVRFIEYMDVGGATHWSPEQVVTRAEILDRITTRYGTPEPAPDPGHTAAPAERFRLPDGTPFGIVASTSAPFCGTCDRARLTADGTWFLCLYASRGLDLREALRSGVSDEDLATMIGVTWRDRRDRGAEKRLGMSQRAALIPAAELRADPHREMHTRGG